MIKFWSNYIQSTLVSAMSLQTVQMFFLSNNILTMYPENRITEFLCEKCIISFILMQVPSHLVNSICWTFFKYITLGIKPCSLIQLISNIYCSQRSVEFLVENKREDILTNKICFVIIHFLRLISNSKIAKF